MAAHGWLSGLLLCPGRAGQTDGIGRSLHRPDDERDVLIEVYAQLRRALDHVFPADATGERLVLHLLPHGARLHFVYAARGLYERRRSDEPRELIHGEQRLGHRRRAWRVAVGRMAQDGFEDVLGPATGAQDPHALA